MSDDPAGACAVACGTVCLELIGGLCLDFASISKSLRVLVAHAFDASLQPIHAPVASAHGHPTRTRTMRAKRQTRENGISSYQSPTNRRRLQPCPNLHLAHEPVPFAPPFPMYHRIIRAIVAHPSRLWIVTIYHSPVFAFPMISVTHFLAIRHSDGISQPVQSSR